MKIQVRKRITHRPLDGGSGQDQTGFISIRREILHHCNRSEEELLGDKDKTGVYPLYLYQEGTFVYIPICCFLKVQLPPSTYTRFLAILPYTTQTSFLESFPWQVQSALEASPCAPRCCLRIALGLLCRLLGVYLSVFPTGLHTHFEGRGIFYLPLFLGA